MVSERIKKYYENDRQAKFFTAEVNAEKDYVKKVIERAQRLGIRVQGFKFYKRSGKVTLNDDEVYEYIKDCCSETVFNEEGEVVSKSLDEEKFNLFCKKVIDLEKVREVANSLNMDILPFPAFCYDVGKETRALETSHDL